VCTESTHVTETVYRNVLVPAIRGGATVMDGVVGPVRRAVLQWDAPRLPGVGLGAGLVAGDEPERHFLEAGGQDDRGEEEDGSDGEDQVASGGESGEERVDQWLGQPVEERGVRQAAGKVLVQ